MQKYCGNCGSEIPVGNGFCPKCGTMISMNTANHPASTTVVKRVGQTDSSSNQPAENIYGKRSLILFGIECACLFFCMIFVDTLITIPFMFIGIISWMLGLAFGIAGTCKKGVAKGMAVTGILLHVLPVLMFIIFAASWSAGHDSGLEDGYKAGYEQGYDVPWYEKY